MAPKHVNPGHSNEESKRPVGRPMASCVLCFLTNQIKANLSPSVQGAHPRAAQLPLGAAEACWQKQLCSCCLSSHHETYRLCSARACICGIKALRAGARVSVTQCSKQGPGPSQVLCFRSCEACRRTHPVLAVELWLCTCLLLSCLAAEGAARHWGS